MRTRLAGPAFAQWLTTQLAITGISRRQLAQLSGVDHSTISRLTLGQRMPSLETATKLARVLPDLHEHLSDLPTLTGLSMRASNGPARLEYALRSDEALTRDDVRAVMDFYLSVRSRAMAKRAGEQRGRPLSAPITVRRSHAPDPLAAPDLHRQAPGFRALAGVGAK
jgi:transcriptional regulator with XRE-family HTH domain